MFSYTQGQILQIRVDLPEIQELVVQIQGKPISELAYNYPLLYRSLKVGDLVKLNTSAVDRSLGTGGRHFVLPEYNAEYQEKCPGHIMKLRYSPWQFPVLSAEEEASPYHEKIQDCDSLDNTPVVIAPLHSMLPGIILGFRNCFRKPAKIVFIMTDGAALPIALSNIIRDLKTRKLLDYTVTTGHAFGGDLETVSIPSALVTAKQVWNPELIVVGMGPGVVGTETKLGFSGIEQSWVIDLTANLKGIPIVAPRVGSSDPRLRHRGMSHHTLTILRLANQPAYIGFSIQMPPDLQKQIGVQIEQNGLLAKHHFVSVVDQSVIELLTENQVNVQTMGRGVEQEQWFFQNAVSAGALAALSYSQSLDSMCPFGR